jgi:hypothetical protein
MRVQQDQVRRAPGHLKKSLRGGPQQGRSLTASSPAATISIFADDPRPSSATTATVIAGPPLRSTSSRGRPDFYHGLHNPRALAVMRGLGRFYRLFTGCFDHRAIR